MNRKMIALVMVVVIGILAVSAFSWTTDHDSNHQGLAIYQQSERASYMGDQVAADVMAYHWDAMAKFYAGQASAAANLSWPARPDFSFLNAKAMIPVTGSAEGLAIYHQSEWNPVHAMSFPYIPLGR